MTRTKRWSTFIGGLRLCVLVVLLPGQLGAQTPAAARFKAATFNVENYHLADTATRRMKPEAARAKVASAILEMRPDVLALQEIGGAAALADLQARVRAGGWNLEHSELVHGADTNIQVCLLSRFPIVQRSPHTNESYLVDGRRHRVSRGFLEVELQVTDRYRLTVLAAHLKSKRVVADAAESDLREQEARQLRNRIETILRGDPEKNLLVCGDLNDSPDSLPLRIIMGQGVRGLLDTRPAEMNGDAAAAANPRQRPRRIVWTHHFGLEDSYGRFDYLLLSRGLAREWQPQGTYVYVQPDWGVASDHRPIIAEFLAAER